MSLLNRLRGLLRPIAAPAAPVRPLAERIDFNDPAIARDPYPHWAALLAEGPVHHLPVTGGWMVLGFEAVRQAFATPEIFSNAPYGYVDSVLLGEDPPGQQAIRRLVSPHFTPRALDRLEAVGARAARAAIAPRFDAVTGFSEVVSRTVAAELIGFDAATIADIHAATQAAASEPLPVLIAALDAFGPRAGIYEQLLRDGDGLIGEVETRSLVRLLWLAAITTTERVIVRCVMMLAEDVRLQQQVRSDRALIAPFVEEAMRLYPPEQVLPRVAAVETELFGARIPAGAPVFLCIGAANRDPSQFDAPAEFRLERASKRHLTFGGGIHHCVGAPLARRVIAAAMNALLDASPNLRPAEPLDALPWFVTMNALSPTRLEVEI